MPKVSIILPVYNGSNYIKNTINSILQQSFNDFELIIIDDGSVDDSLKVIERFTDNRIRVIREENLGICRARNNGIKEAKTDYIMFCDHDDMYLPGFINMAYDQIKGSTCDFVKFGCKEIYIKKDKITHEHLEIRRNKIFKKKNIDNFLFEYTYDNEYIWDGIFRKDSLQKAGLFNLKYTAGCEDVALLLELLKVANECKTIDYIAYNHYIRNSSSTSRKYSEITYQSVLEMYAERLKNVNNSNKNYENYAIEKSKQLVWALAGMFSFSNCHLNSKEIQDRLNILPIDKEIIRAYKGKKRLPVFHNKQEMIWDLFVNGHYSIIAHACTLKRGFNL